MSDQHSPLLCDPADKARIEAENGVEQLDYISYLATELKLKDVRVSHVLEFHKLAVKNIYPCAGTYRNALYQIVIRGSEHQVPHESRVPGLVSDLVDFLNATRDGMPTLDRAAFALWRFNWIHPFAGGNGRTARALCYLVISLDMGQVPPGVPQMPTLIYERRNEYVSALRMADEGERVGGNPNLVPMRDMLEDIITQQLASAIHKLGIRPAE